ncbi:MULTISPECIES: hypothetical protein [unclassified Rhizobium]|uniref:hypothetical protein n=1 Tax=unclassified Rhizobium TaxID=2613769 RepID=UPI0007F17114|nr:MULTISPECIES: hypothetical protein [unclassified Rhizobium]ANM11306.1 hypothetical protein AMK05_CH02937 [Rhizobium sp. N324]OYD04907.1 hypothetical protein AMK08_CH102954 [Rhizobium sp. N4311]
MDKISGSGSSILSPNGPRDAERKAEWLGETPYSMDQWPLGVDRATGKAVFADFDYMLTPNRKLKDTPSLYRTAKEAAFWVRQSDIADLGPLSHKKWIDNMLHILSAVARIGIYDLSRLLPRDLHAVLRKAIEGAEGLLGFAAYLDAKLSEYAQLAELPANWLDVDGHASLRLICRELNLKDGWRNKSVKQTFLQHTRRWANEEAVPKASPTRKPTRSAYDRSFIVCDHMYALRFHMDARSIEVDPISVAPEEEADRKTDQIQHTPIPPPRLVFEFAHHFGRAVAIDGPSVVKEYKERLAASASVSRELAGAINAKMRLLLKNSFGLLLAHLPVRPAQIRMLEKDCLYKDPSGQWWIKVPRLKKRRPDVRLMPAVEAVVFTVQQLEAVMTYLPPDASPRMFQFSNVHDRRAELVNFTNSGANHLASVYKLPKFRSKTSEWERWHWQLRQFRRFSPTLYYWKYESSIEGVANMLDQENISVTRRYTALDPDVAALWDEEEWRYVQNVVESVLEGQENYGGTPALTILRLGEKIKAVIKDNLKVVTMRNVASAVAQLFKNHGVMVIMQDWGICFHWNYSGRAPREFCRRLSGKEGQGPDLTHAAPEVCGSGCPFCLSARKTRAVMDEVIKLRGEPVPALLEGTLFQELQDERTMKFLAFRGKLEPRPALQLEDVSNER